MGDISAGIFNEIDKDGFVMYTVCNLTGAGRRLKKVMSK